MAARPPVRQFNYLVGVEPDVPKTGRADAMDGDTFLKILEWAWLALIGMGVTIWRKISGMEMRQAVLDQQNLHFEKQRIEDKKLRDEQRREMVSLVNKHHETVMTEITELKRIAKNGH